MRAIGLLRWLLLLLAVTGVTAEPLSLALGAGVSLLGGAVLYNFGVLKCKYYECCGDPKWMPADFTRLRESLQSRLYGQPLVLDTVLHSLKAHWSNPNPTKALVLSFHGWTGCGKNHVSNLIAEALYRRGHRSDFVRMYLATLHFPHLDDAHAAEYASRLRSWITGNITLCDRSLFIFDEIDKMSARVLEGVKPFIDHHSHIQGVDFRKATFIFLSNTGAHDIADLIVAHERAGRDRRAVPLADVESVIHRAAFNEKGVLSWWRWLWGVDRLIDRLRPYATTTSDEPDKLEATHDGGLRFSTLIEHNLIDHFIPFFPLQRQHVKLCIRDYLLSRGWAATPERINRAADELQYVPDDSKLYSKSGCKRVPHKVDLIIQEEFERDYEASRQKTIEL